jgi:hypothetical protein
MYRAIFGNRARLDLNNRSTPTDLTAEVFNRFEGKSMDKNVNKIIGSTLR